MQKITGVRPQSIGEQIGVRPGDHLLSINGQPVEDIIDYEYLSAEEALFLRFQDSAGATFEVEVEKDASAQLGLEFATGLMSEVRTCHNHCIFCFIDQMAEGGRDTLQFKDDDWRMSFIMGNYITLTNVNDEEFARILARRVSPLYISVHATDPQVRSAMMRNPRAGLLMERLRALCDAGLRFHCQIVCCPGVNDGQVLRRTLEDLASLYPAAQSVAVVPVGLTKFREGLFPLRRFSRDEARALLCDIRAFADRHRTKNGSAFVYAADELVLLAEEALPPYEAYDDFPQIENGVGLLRLFENEFLAALEEKMPLHNAIVCDAAGGVAAHAFMKNLFQRLKAYTIQCIPHAIRNAYFGESITVGGLVTGRDLVAQCKGKLVSNVLFLPHNMLREREDVFLDGMTVDEVAAALQVHVIPVRGEGEAWVEALFAQGNIQEKKERL